MSSKNKKYGLILPDKIKIKPPVFQASRNVFGNDSDSDDESNKKPILLRPSDNTNRQAKISQEKAITEDPTVYQYDEIYDTMTTKKEERKVKSKEEKKPRYIENLMKAASKRKIENERRIERQVQKEREQEGDEFADKEVFVTSAYKKKLEEMRLEEEKEKREEYLEKIGDVTKQKDLGGFYRHLYEQKLGSDENKNSNEKGQETEKEGDVKEKENSKVKAKTDEPEILETKKRNYRKRKSSSEIKKYLSEGEIEDSEEEINRLNLEDIKAKKSKQNQENIDADSDFSIDESSDEEENEKSNKEQLIEKPVCSNSEKESNEPVQNSTGEDKSDISNKQDVKITEQPKPKIDIWKKRTVGEVFEQALKRYYERKAARGS